MADTSIVIASALVKYPHIMAIHDIIRDRLNDIPLSAVLVYIIDYVDADALPVLAEQFNVTGYKGYFLATNEAERRTIIKSAIDLQRWKGTPWSIKEALRAFGYGSVTIEEGTGIGIKYDGIYTHNGSQTYGGSYHWANFDVILNTADYPSGLTADDTEIIYQIINEYKNVRSNLRELRIEATLSEPLTAADSNIVV